MSPACGRPLGEGSGQSHVDRVGIKPDFSCARHKWMSPNFAKSAAVVTGNLTADK